MTLFFPDKGEQKKFSLLQALVSGFIKIDAPNFNELIEMYRKAIRMETSAEQQYERAVRALEPYKEYLD